MIYLPDGLIRPKLFHSARRKPLNSQVVDICNAWSRTIYADSWKTQYWYQSPRLLVFRHPVRVYCHHRIVTRLTHHLVCRLPESPTLWKGGSDPFNSCTVYVSPLVNRMIVFARDCYYPSLAYAPWLRRWFIPKNGKPWLFFNLGSSSADCMAAHLASYGAALVQILPVDARRCLEPVRLETRSLALRTLRRSLTAHGSTAEGTVILIQQCLYLFQADVEARMFTSAEHHGKMLRQLFANVPWTSRSVYLYLSGIHTVLQMVCFQFKAPVMTFDEWHPRRWRSTWFRAEVMLASLSPLPAATIHEDIKYSNLREILNRFRWTLTPPCINPCSIASQIKNQNDMISLWSATRLIDDTIELLKRFIVLTKRETQSSMFQAEMLWEATLMLSTACTIRHYLCSPRLDGSSINLRDVSLVIAPKLRDTILNLLAVTSELDLQNHAEVWLWIYFTGALYEQQNGLYRQKMLRHMGTHHEAVWWFSRNLARQAHRRSLIRWADARILLEQFAFGDGLLDPQPDAWWDEVAEMSRSSFTCERTTLLMSSTQMFGEHAVIPTL